MKVTDKKQLPELVDLIHDFWFNVEILRVDWVNNCVTFRAEPSRSGLTANTPEGITVTVKHVEDISIQDTENVRDYDINELIYDPTKQTLTLTGGIPIEISMRVSGLEVIATDDTIVERD